MDFDTNPNSMPWIVAQFFCWIFILLLSIHQLPIYLSLPICVIVANLTIYRRKFRLGPFRTTLYACSSAYVEGKLGDVESVINAYEAELSDGCHHSSIVPCEDDGEYKLVGGLCNMTGVIFGFLWTDDDTFEYSIDWTTAQTNQTIATITMVHTLEWRRDMLHIERMVFCQQKALWWMPMWLVAQYTAWWHKRELAALVRFIDRGCPCAPRLDT